MNPRPITPHCGKPRCAPPAATNMPTCVTNEPTLAASSMSSPPVTPCPERLMPETPAPDSAVTNPPDRPTSSPMPSDGQTGRREPMSAPLVFRQVSYFVSAFERMKLWRRQWEHPERRSLTSGRTLDQVRRTASSAHGLRFCR